MVSPKQPGPNFEIKTQPTWRKKKTNRLWSRQSTGVILVTERRFIWFNRASTASTELSV